ncbi:MAG: amidohydrolase [Rhodospirillales bacterium]|nr:amidohydrolase [Rhodospirillales bacterium]
MDVDFDIVIRGGTVIDGSGSAPFAADIAIKDGKIVVVGKISGRGSEEISAKGRIVTPGFVDIHTHYDGQITWENRLAPSSYHGVTTVLMGNCGVGFAPCKPEHREMLVKVMEGVEDIPEIVMTEGVPWNWESFPEYLDALDKREADIDFAAQIPHGPVRVNVMGQRGADREPPTVADLAEMTRIVAEAIRAGALGVTTSRSMAHRTAAGELAPTVTSEEQELLALADGLRQAGAGVFQIIPGVHEGRDPVEEVALMRRLIVLSGRPLSFSLMQTGQFPDAMPLTLELLARATAEGVPMKAQVFPRGVGVMLGLELSFHPFRYNPSYRAIEHLPVAERVAAMRDPAKRARLMAESPVHENPIHVWFASQDADLYPLGDPPNYEPDPEEKVGARAAQLGQSPREFIYNLMLESDGHAIFLLPAANFVGSTLEPVRTMMEHPDSLIALGDGGAHYGMICDSSFPTSLLAYWTRDRKKGPRMPLVRAVNALTRANALAVGLTDRGLIAPGMKADINIIDYDNLTLHPPRVVADLPAGGKRMIQDADGYDTTIVSGVVTYRAGIPTGALPGRLVRGGGTRLG